MTFLIAASLSAQSVEARFTTNKSTYLAGEPIFVVLTVSNKGSEPIWVDFDSSDMSWLCHDFAIEAPGAESAQNQWGCGFAVSCGRGLREISPNQSLSVRQLLNSQFRLQSGAEAILARTAIVVHNQNLDSAKIDKLEVSDSLQVAVERGSENQLKAAFQPYVAELDSPDLMKRSEAAVAITALAPPFLEDVLISLTKSNYAYAAIEALRKADTVKTREALAQLAIGGEDLPLRIEAIRNLGRTNDETYLPTLMRLVESNNKQILNDAAEATGNLGGPKAIGQLATLVSSPDDRTRLAAANGLGETHARQAVPILVPMLLDSDANVRQAAVSGLYMLTHHAVFDSNQWADITNPESTATVHQHWVAWWDSHRKDIDIHGMADCAPPEPLN